MATRETKRSSKKVSGKKLPKGVGPAGLLVGTRKGAFFLRTDSRRAQWKISPPLYLGHDINHFVADPRDRKVLLIGAKTGHLGPTVFRSLDRGKTWKEAAAPPKFAQAADGKAVERVFWLTPGHDSEPGVWYAGTAPAGLFRSADHGDTWEPVAGFNDNPMKKQWAPSMGTPDGEFLHSIIIDPRDRDHMYLGISVGGVFESTDRGRSWEPLNSGCAADFLPDPNVPFGHDPHHIVMHPKHPDRLYQQNHCGIYRIDRPSKTWERIGKNMPKNIGDVGFPIVLHPDDQDKAWVFPMDGTTVWPRTSVGGKPAVFTTADAGKTWRKQSKGLPASDAWLTVKRQAMCSDAARPLGLYFGTTNGEIWGSRDEGASWKCIARHLPQIYSLAAWV